MSKGSFTILANQQMLMIRPVGAWSQHVAKRYVQRIDDYLARTQANFTSVVDLRRWELGTPEAIKIISENDMKAVSMGYQLEFHYGDPLTLPMQISKQSITPEGLNMIQTTNLDVIEQHCSELGYRFDIESLKDFLNC